MYEEKDLQGPLSLEQYMNLTEYLHGKGDAQASGSEFAPICGESRECSTRLFKEPTGITTKQFIGRVIISRCLTLLQSGRSSKEIADALQFSSEILFSCYFKRNMNAPKAMDY